ncbi:MAG: histidine kinase [Bacteroidetes bacterium]|nr:histidine kinase [Bacteroidota bacterium]
MRKVLDASGRDKIDLQQEIELLEHYLELEKLRFGDDFTFKIIIDSNVEPAFIQIPPLIIQPFIENAIKHGLLHKKGIKTLLIHFEYQEWLKCTITDNGVGRIRSEEIQNRNIVQKSSFATKATEKRIALLNKYSDKKFNLQIIDLYEDQIPSGTKVIIDFPVDGL